MPPLELILNVTVGGILTGLVYGLMALGLSVIFGVVRVVNFAHGEMMTIAMYLAIMLFSTLGLDPLLMLVPIAIVLRESSIPSSIARSTASSCCCWRWL
jgi:branched-chain amino acid transport system permease protein